jgi:protoheme IX farnesyltransferase
LLIATGAVTLYLLNESLLPVALGLLGIALYNGVYTPLKRITALSIIPGSICGALPILVGWTATGSAITPGAWAFMAVLCVWQLPHAWLMQLIHRDQYATARLPTMCQLFTETQLYRLVFTWTTVFVVATLLLPLFEIVHTQAIVWILNINALTLVGLFAKPLFKKPTPQTYHILFRTLNSSATLVIALIAINPL